MVAASFADAWFLFEHLPHPGFQKLRRQPGKISRSGHAGPRFPRFTLEIRIANIIRSLSRVIGFAIFIFKNEEFCSAGRAFCRAKRTAEYRPLARSVPAETKKIKKTEKKEKGLLFSVASPGDFTRLPRVSPMKEGARFQNLAPSACTGTARQGKAPLSFRKEYPQISQRDAD
ncbi:MAG: hypothetical protein PHQ12_10710 [Chthoniobacteraceae bacterium]|nr:hypothetical protein [Chthoniobacteraceae bacterium]